ncbi:hypothetical protein BJI47_18770 [Rhodococcus sp. 1168]|nr:hypothetical protein BJI47_18770 [Rhodococcus sp. 1168]
MSGPPTGEVADLKTCSGRGTAKAKLALSERTYVPTGRAAYARDEHDPGQGSAFIGLERRELRRRDLQRPSVPDLDAN